MQPYLKSCMISQGGFVAHATTAIVFVQNRMNSESYVDMLVEKILPFDADGDYLFRQDNSILSVSRASCSWFDAESVQFLACLP